ncbi:Rpn family recombination-promoting nuclease/putative transposase [Cupriavidus respiraculi]|uniref:Transposase n=1 Tax=Cupriavidus respiraculi TaxID=195930 RepID=A0ABM8XBD5_9BURK|nr:Rpn family recombination-promoting nuclease/putative transposase [Cupriavidus respiraculi]CAG9177346.1 hypothetical protein LMG21510_03273 [Cupriavidus respiraculi]
MQEPCDASYKLMFSSPKIVRDLVRGFIPDDLLHSLDFASLEKVPCSYVTDHLRQRAGDVVWRVKVDGEAAYLYLVIEFQRTVDPFMAVRIQTYVGLLYQNLIRAGQALPGRRLPPVLPIVMYNGAAGWTAATDIAHLIPGMSALLVRHRPGLAYLLLDENQYSDDQLARMDNLVACMIRFQRAPFGAVLCEVVDRLIGLLDDDAELKRTFALWFRAVVSVRSDHAVSLPKIEDLKELRMVMGQSFEEWKQQCRMEGLWEGRQEGLQAGRQEGRQEGRLEGEAMLLQRMLTRRFGALPQQLVWRIESSPLEQIDAWADRLLTASTLEEVFES